MSERPPWARVLVSVTAAATVSMLPVFLLGSAAPAIRGDLRFDAGRLGLVVSAFWITMALGGLVGGRLAQELGATVMIYTGVGTSVIALLGLALSPSWAVLLIFASLGGFGSSIVTPAGDMALFGVVPPGRRGIAYGVKQASLPGASLLAGGFVPLLVLTVGWRWAFIVGTILAVPALFAMPRHELHSTRRDRTQGDIADSRPGMLGNVVPVAIAVGLAMAGVSSMGAFYVESAVVGGASIRVAGTLLALGGVFGIAGRFLFSWRLGQSAQPYAAVAGLVGLGGAGAISFAIHGYGVVLIAGTVVAFGAGWGWNGLLTQTVVSSQPQAPARASAYIMVGAAVGGVVGPALFGAVVSHAGYSSAWSLCAAQFGLAATVLFVLCARNATATDTEAASSVTPAVPAPPP